MDSLLPVSLWGIRAFAGIVATFAVASLLGCGSGEDDAYPAPEGMESVLTSFRVSVPVNPHGRSVSIVIDGGYCVGNPAKSQTTVNHVDAEQSADEIVLTVYANVWAGLCSGIGGQVRHEVQLDEPIGDRVILDGIADPPAQRWPRPDSELSD